MISVTSAFYWYHVVTLTSDLCQGQICCLAGDHNSSNLLVHLKVEIEGSTAHFDMFIFVIRAAL